MNNLQEENARTQVRVAVKIASLSAESVVSALRLGMRLLEKEHPGKVTMRQLMRDGAQLQKAQISDVDLKALSQMAKEYKVSFSVVQDLEKGGYTVFFKARSGAQMEALIEAYMRQRLELEKKQPQREPFRVRVERAEQRQQQYEQQRQKEPQKGKEHYRQHRQERGERNR